jgi:hypothetical protein
VKLYHNPAGPRAEQFYCADVAPASAYALEQKLQRQYRTALYAADLDPLIAACFGEGLKSKKVQAAEERLQYDVPELIQRMDAAELQDTAAALATLPLQEFVAQVLKLERHLLQREDELGRHRVDDKGHCKAAGLGKGKRPAKLPTIAAPTKPVHVAPQPILRVNRRKKAKYNPYHEQQLRLW